MAEPTTADVETYTGGRLVDGDDDTALFLASALAAARKYCGWHVTPVKTGDVVKVDGPGRPVLMLPTLKLVALTAVTEDGISLNIADLDVSAIGQVRKKSALTSIWPLRHWWSSNYGAIIVTMTHGFADVPDWNMAVLSMVDQMSLSIGGGGSGNLIDKTVDDVTLRWSNKAPVTALGEATHLLDKYRLFPIA